MRGPGVTFFYIILTQVLTFFIQACHMTLKCRAGKLQIPKGQFNQKPETMYTATGVFWGWKPE